MSLGEHPIDRSKRRMVIAEGEVGIPGEIPPMSKGLSAPKPNALNKRDNDMIDLVTVWDKQGSRTYHWAEDELGEKISEVKTTDYRFTNGDSFAKVRGMINLMRSKVKAKFTRKKKKGKDPVWDEINEAMKQINMRSYYVVKRWRARKDKRMRGSDGYYCPL